MGGMKSAPAVSEELRKAVESGDKNEIIEASIDQAMGGKATFKGPGTLNGIRVSPK